MSQIFLFQGKSSLERTKFLACFMDKKNTLKDMRKHVGGHILRDLCDCAAPHECKSHWPIGENPCGFCGLDGCLTQLKKKDCCFTITSTCPYHYPQFPKSHTQSGNTMLCSI